MARTAKQIFDDMIANTNAIDERRKAWYQFDRENKRLWKEAEAAGLDGQVKQMVLDWQKSQPAQAR